MYENNYFTFDRTDDFLWVLIFCLFGVVLAQLYDIHNAHFLGKIEQTKQELPKLIINTVTQPLRIIFSFLKMGAKGLGIAYLIGMFGALPLYIKYFRKEPIGKFDKDLAKQYLKIGFPVIIISFSMIFTEYVDKILIQHYSDITQLGYYSFSQSITGLFKMGSLSVGLLFFPTFSKYLSDGKISDIFLLINKYEKLLIAIGIPFITVFVFFSPEIILILGGKKFIDSYPIFSMLLISVFVFSYFHSYENLLAGNQKFKISAILSCTKSVLFLGFAFIITFFISKNIALNLAISFIFANLITGFITKLISTRYLKAKFKIYNLKVISVHLIIITALFIIIKIFINNFYELISLRIFLFSGYILIVVAMNYFFKLISINEIKLLFKNFNPKTTAKYIKDEIK